MQSVARISAVAKQRLVGRQMTSWPMACHWLRNIAIIDKWQVTCSWPVCAIHLSYESVHCHQSTAEFGFKLLNSSEIIYKRQNLNWNELKSCRSDRATSVTLTYFLIISRWRWTSCTLRMWPWPWPCWSMLSAMSEDAEMLLETEGRRWGEGEGEGRVSLDTVRSLLRDDVTTLTSSSVCEYCTKSLPSSTTIVGHTTTVTSHNYVICTKSRSSLCLY